MIPLARTLAIALAALACGSPPVAPEPPVPAARPDVAPLQPRAAEPPADATVARWQGGALTHADLDARIGPELRARELRYLLDRYELQAQAIDALLTDALLREEVQRRGLPDIEALLREEVERRIPEPSDDEVERLYPLLAHQLQGASLDEARPLIVAEVVRRASQRRQRDFLDELRARAELSIVLPYPDLPRLEVPVGAADPSRGPSDARVVIVEFAEYQCYYCGRVGPTLDQLAARYPDDLRIVWKDFPLSSHGRARPAAIAARCAGDQGRYWEMSDLLLANQQALTESDIAAYARRIELSIEDFQRCLTDGRHAAALQADIDLGRRLGVQVTPTFFINGVLLAGAQPIERFQTLIERELAD
jgi:protein-disulfide isomerase